MGGSMNATFRVDDIRVPEEHLYFEKITSNPVYKKLLKKVPEIAQPEVHWLSFLNKEAVKITRQTRPDLIGGIETSYLLFGKEAPPYEVFGIKNFEREEFDVSMDQENACVLMDGDTICLVFVHNILKTMTPAEIQSIVGHEIGHCILGHIAARNDLSVLQVMIDQIEEGSETEEFRELERAYYLWNQIQELSADRIGLMVARDLDATISGLAKLAGGFISERISIQDYIDQARSYPPDVQDWRQTHPYHPHRSWALFEFYESDCFRRFLGQVGGKSLGKFSELLPRIIPLREESSARPPSAVPTEHEGIEECLLEVGLYNSISLADHRLTPAENAIMVKAIPRKLRREVAKRWNQSVQDQKLKTAEEMLVIVDSMLQGASLKDHRWKTKVIKNMIKIVRSDRRIRDDELIAIADLAGRFDARDECRIQFLKEFGIDPYPE